MSDRHAIRTVANVGVGVAAYALVTAGLARFWVWSSDGWRSGDLPSFYIWTALSALILAPCLFAFNIRSDERSVPRVALAALGAGIGFALGGSIVLAGVLGPWFGAFSFPVLAWWASGAVCAFLITCGVATARRSLLAAGLIPVSAVAIFLAYERATRPIDDLEVFFAPDVTRPQVEHVWTDVIGDGDVAPVPGVIRRCLTGYDGGPAIRVAFSGSEGSAHRARIRRAAAVAPGVVRVAETSPYPRRNLREGMLPNKIGYDAVVRPAVETEPADRQP